MAQAQGSVCSSGIYNDLRLLSAYPAAEAFCSSHFPEPKCTVTITSQPSQSLHKRLPATIHATTTTSAHTTAASGVMTENQIPYLFSQPSLEGVLKRLTLFVTMEWLDLIPGYSELLYFLENTLMPNDGYMKTSELECTIL
jgi:hypothetical protein